MRGYYYFYRSGNGFVCSDMIRVANLWLSHRCQNWGYIQLSLLYHRSRYSPQRICFGGDQPSRPAGTASWRPTRSKSKCQGT